ncbi:hypothetical protein chiPu_0003576 [Chiloscyllium punctatum]|uniref:Uncharacterized protein n=1 Tax=Chiloscyllium punctatum TaxID=137246 RepID=A0A401S461_CHIPU|nr:hypothetical protein [Chiloscyllium punctatum]
MNRRNRQPSHTTTTSALASKWRKPSEAHFPVSPAHLPPLLLLLDQHGPHFRQTVHWSPSRSPSGQSTRRHGTLAVIVSGRPAPLAGNMPRDLSVALPHGGCSLFAQEAPFSFSASDGIEWTTTPRRVCSCAGQSVAMIYGHLTRNCEGGFVYNIWPLICDILIHVSCVNHK